MDSTLELTNLFGPSNKVVYLKKLVFQSAVRFLILFVLMDAILLKLDLQKRTNDLDNPPNGKLFVQQKCIIYPKIGNVFLIFNIKLSQDSVNHCCILILKSCLFTKTVAALFKPSVFFIVWTVAAICHQNAATHDL